MLSEASLEGKTKSQLSRLACYAEQAERYDDMVTAMKKLVGLQQQAKEKLTTDERHLFSVAYKNVIGLKRSSWRILSNVDIKDESNERRLALNDAYKRRIELELIGICEEVLGMLNDYLIPSTTDGDVESITFYLKMKGDYFRYQAEVASPEDKKDLTAESQRAYTEAFSIATSKMKATDPIRLGLALNYSVFYYEILNSPDQACHLAKKAFDEAMQELGNSPDDSELKDSTMILQLIRDNLTLWTSDLEARDDE